MLYKHADRWLERLKWPIGIVAVAWLPFAIWACLLLVARVLSAPLGTIAFAVGLGVFIAGWKLYLRFKSIGLWLMRAEHEATHLLFAVMTFHPIVGLSRESRHGSHVRFIGSGNWLVQIAPYFFPTAAIFFWLLAVLIPFGSLLFLTSIALGFATGFHVVSTIREIKRDRAELQSLSWKFCRLFLPTANLVMLGAMIGYSQNGWSGVGAFIGDLTLPITYVWSLLFGKGDGAMTAV